MVTGTSEPDSLVLDSTSAYCVLADGADDFVVSGGSSDLLFGDAGSDYLSGGAGDDMLVGGAGDDYLSGGVDGLLTAYGGPGSDTLHATLAASAVLMAGEGADVVVGSDGQGTESSWGLDDVGTERNGMTASGECSSINKEIASTCP